MSPQRPFSASPAQALLAAIQLFRWLLGLRLGFRACAEAQDTILSLNVGILNIRTGLCKSQPYQRRRGSAVQLSDSFPLDIRTKSPPERASFGPAQQRSLKGPALRTTVLMMADVWSRPRHEEDCRPCSRVREQQGPRVSQLLCPQADPPPQAGLQGWLLHFSQVCLTLHPFVPLFL